jgi:CheY-like chemotaxis protein
LTRKQDSAELDRATQKAYSHAGTVTAAPTNGQEQGDLVMVESSLLEGKRILIVDDEPDVLEVLEELLKMCQVERASTFEKAKELLETREFDMAVLDIMGVNGYGLLEIAKRKKIPAVMLTAHAFNPPNLVRSIKEGAASYIPKEEISRIVEFLNDVFEARRKGENPWKPWQERLPASYFEQKFGAAWEDTDKAFWEKFRAGLRDRGSASKDE